MTRKVELGAPSLTGKDANDLVTNEFASAKYPLSVVVTNNMPCNAVFPEVADLFLSHCANPEGRVKAVVIDSMDAFQRLASSIEQIAELNGFASALIIEEAVVVSTAKGKAAQAAAPAVAPVAAPAA